MSNLYENSYCFKKQKKIEELKRILQGLEITILSVNDFPELEEVKEDGLTFDENALKKQDMFVNKLDCLLFLMIQAWKLRH